jgi:hypothetical protein
VTHETLVAELGYALIRSPPIALFLKPENFLIKALIPIRKDIGKTAREGEGLLLVLERPIRARFGIGSRQRRHCAQQTDHRKSAGKESPRARGVLAATTMQGFLPDPWGVESNHG